MAHADLKYASMESVVMEREALLEKIRENKGKHRADFEEAVDAYYERAIELLDEHIARIRAKKVEEVRVYLPMPKDHTADYDTAIAMIELSIFQQVVLTKQEVDWYVLDNWMWKQEFVTTNASYTAGRA